MFRRLSRGRFTALAICMRECTDGLLSPLNILEMWLTLNPVRLEISEKLNRRGPCFNIPTPQSVLGRGP